MGMETSGIMPVMDMNRGYDDGWGGNSFAWIIILFALLGWNRNGDYVTPTQLQNGFDSSNIQNKLNQLQQTVTSGICDGFYSTAQQINGIDKSLAAESYATRDAVNQVGYAVKDCCCTTNRNIDSVKFEAAQNTAAITNAIHQEGEMTRAMIKEQEVQALRDEVTVLRGQISNNEQNGILLNSIGRYVTNPPCAYQGTCNCNY